MKSETKAVIIRNWNMYRRYFPILHFLDRILAYISILIGIWLLNNYLFEGKINENISHYIGNINYFTYATVGLIFENISISILMNISRALITEVREGTLSSVLITPYNYFYYHLGVCIEQCWRMLLETIIIIIISIFFGANFSGISLLMWILTTVFVVFVSFCVGVFLSNIMLYTRDTYISQNTVFTLMFLFCGITFPKEIFPSLFQYLSYLIPLTQALDIFRIVCFNPERMNELYFLFSSGICLSCIYMFSGILFYKKTENKIIEYIFE